MSFNFWTPSLKADFHRVLTSMRQLTDVPSEPRTYRGGRTSQFDTHTLSIEDEMRCADAIEFLAHHKEGARFVSTVTLRECHERLRIVLAGNTTPSSMVQDELAKVMDHGKLLEMVIRLNKSRILSRLRPTWVAQPRHFTRRQMSLQGRVQTCIVSIEKSLQSTAQVTQVLERLKGLGDTLKLVEHPTESSALLDAIKTIVENCAQVASLGSANSVEEHLKSLGIGKRLAESPEIRQIDKLASGATSSLTERLTEVEGNVIPARHGNVVDAMLPRRHSWPVMLSHFVKITELELPWHRYALVGQGPLHIQIDRLSLHMEFASTATGLLSVYRRHDGALDEGKILKAADIPIDSSLPIRGCRATGKVAFGISLNAIVVVQIEFVWETPSHQ
ncbi:hypothetical protein CCUS01_11250 [Colletotrichum cuscutae]|uniref:Uncharacterized protein n=1 Tax=Colletotrichum cuscutae TaxID=1209917 RepID=A0AAI9U3P9_9PEZI|nr:hypothetical protein CCUS01_11250 [Colletotrichum cuscutae]